jgi:Ring finger domain
MGSAGAGRQLSSSAAAVLHTQQQQQQQQVGVVSVGGADLQPRPIDLISSTNTQLLVNTTTTMHDRSFTDGSLDNIGAPDVSGSVVVEMANIGSGVSSGGERIVVSNNYNNNSAYTNAEQRNRASSPTNDRERRARIRWIRINRRFQVVITMVALLFSCLLFGILIGWVVLTSIYVVSFDQSCDLPLKPYFWLVTFQLIMDVFRNDIMRFVFNWDANSNLRIPVRVIVYNVAYLLYAFLVLRMGINSVIVENDSTCRTTAPQLFQATLAFVSLSIAAWATIVFGYLLPFCIVAALLTYNGYNPSSSSFEDESGATQPVFPAAYSTTGAPTGTVELLRVVVMENYPENYPLECCICMEEFNSFDVVVETRCKHIFHKQCCREWLRQARTCPVCRTDIPSSLEDLAINAVTSPTSVSSQAQPPTTGSRIPIGPTGRPVVGLLRIFQSESFNGGTGGGGGGGPGSRGDSPVAGAAPGDSSRHSHS